MTPPLESDSTIAERTLGARSRKSGEEKFIKITIGRPFWVTEKQIAACLVVVDGLYGRLQDISGVDPIDALRNAVIVVENLLDGAHEDYELFWPNGEPFEKDD